jgi:hypothetical protein
MALRKNLFLKYLTILLFTLELLAPVFLSAQALLFTAGDTSQHDSVQQASNPPNFFSIMLCEEAENEEERDEREHSRHFFSLISLNPPSYAFLLLKSDDLVARNKFFEPSSAHASLIKLYRVFRI